MHVLHVPGIETYILNVDQIVDIRLNAAGVHPKLKAFTSASSLKGIHLPPLGVWANLLNHQVTTKTDQWPLLLGNSIGAQRTTLGSFFQHWILFFSSNFRSKDKNKTALTFSNISNLTWTKTITRFWKTFILGEKNSIKIYCNLSIISSRNSNQYWTIFIENY